MGKKGKREKRGRAVPERFERRVFGRDLELRVLDGEEDAGPVIEGYAALFNRPSDDLGGFIELIEPGAFERTISKSDVRALHNHNRDHVLGRSTARTLELREDETGLAVRIRPPAATWAEDLLVSMRRGDVDQMSFGFETIRDRWETIGGQVYRYLLEVELFDVSVVTFPAYPETSAEVRAKAESVHEDAASAEPDSGGAQGGDPELGDGKAGSRGRLAVARARVELARRRVGLGSG